MTAALRDAIEATGSVRCPLRAGAPLARDRCVELQGRGGCACPAGAAAKIVHLAHRAAEAEDAARTAAALEAQRVGRKPWKLTCKRCRRPFEAERLFGAKPRYCGAECRDAEVKDRKRDAARRARARREDHAGAQVY